MLRQALRALGRRGVVSRGHEPVRADPGGLSALTAYVIEGQHCALRPAPLEREWMDASDGRYAYRCLPLNIANAHGWEILCPAGFAATWNGGAGRDAIAIEADPGTTKAVESHFGGGVLTFHVPLVFRTPPGIDLMVQGPINRPKDAIAPLSGIVETDWSPYTFTMNWLFTRSNTRIRFEKDEPYCHIFPLRRGELETIEPVLRPLTDDLELKRQYEIWTDSRGRFNTGLARGGSRAQAEKWQKRYYQGMDVEGRTAADDHRTRLRLKPFVKR